MKNGGGCCRKGCGMREDIQKLQERIFQFAVDIVLLTDGMGQTIAGRHMAYQMIF